MAGNEIFHNGQWYDRNGSAIPDPEVWHDDGVYETGTALLRSPEAANFGPGKPIFISGGGTAQIVQRRGRNCVEVTMNAGANTASLMVSIPSGLQDGDAQLVYEFEDASVFSGGIQSLRFYSDIGATVGMQAPRTIGTGNGWSGVQVFIPKLSEWAPLGGGSFAATTMTYAQVKFQTSGASSPGGRVWVYEISRKPKRAIPRIYIGADDGAYSWYTLGLPMLEKYGLKSYLAFITDSKDQGHPQSMNLADWQDAVLVRGHEAIIHGPRAGHASLRDYFTAHPGFPTAYEAILDDISYNRDGMIAANLDPSGKGRKVYVLPQGYHQPLNTAGDTTVATALGVAGIKACRLAATDLGGTGIVMSPAYARQALYLAIIGHGYAGAGEAANIAALIALMQSEIALGHDVIFMFHEVVASPTISQQITQANLGLICAAIADLINTGAARQGYMQDLPARVDAELAKVIV